MDLRTYLSQEKLNQVNQAWKYLKPWHRASLFIRATWWSLPGIFDIRDRINHRINCWLTYYLYKAHWIGRYQRVAPGAPVSQTEQMQRARPFL
jgi:hypothetical protein